MDILNLTPAQLKHAANVKEQIAALEDELQSIVRGGAGRARNGAPTASRMRRNRMSAAGRARIIAAQRARWAKYKKSHSRGRSASAVKRRTLSAAAKAKIAAAARARWARAKAAGRNSL
jgi:hypothetical protein